MRRIFACLLCALLLCPRASGAESPNYVALTFDDGPSGRFTRALLDGLRERDIRATFLLCGYRMQSDPALTERIAAEGHEIGLHGFSHRSMKSMSRREIAGELQETKALLPEGCEPVFLRPPGGCCSDAVEQVAKGMGLAILDWSVDPKDWATDDVSAIRKRVLDRVEDGDVVLLHDMSDSSVQAALEIADELQRRGFRLVTVSELAQRRGKQLQPGKIYCKFPPK